MLTSKSTRIGKEFRAAMTTQAYVGAVVPVLGAIYLLFNAAAFNKQFAPADPSRWMFIVPMVLGALVVIAGVAWGVRRELAHKLMITGSHLHYEGRGKNNAFSATWKSLITSVPTNQNGFLQALLIAYGDKQITIYNLFMPKFDVLVREVQKRKSNALSMESGQVGTIDL